MAKAKKVATAALVGAAIAGAGVVLSKKENRAKLVKLSKKVQKEGGKALSQVGKRGAALNKLVQSQLKKTQSKPKPAKKTAKKASNTKKGAKR